MNPLVWFLIIIFLFIGSHLTVDKDFPPSIKTAAMVIMGIISGLYIVFGILL